MNLRELTLKASFSLTNSHPVLGDVYPRNPNSVNIAGLHIRPPKQIEDEEIRDSVCKVWRIGDHKFNLSYRNWLDGAEEGVILVSFGSVSESNVKVSMYV